MYSDLPMSVQSSWFRECTGTAYDYHLPVNMEILYNTAVEKSMHMDLADDNMANIKTYLL